FYCKGAVNVGRLLHLSRKELYDLARSSGANVLLNEEWCCKITHPLFKGKNHYRVRILYSADLACSMLSDAQKPVAVEDAKGVEGVMIILDRQQ
ncbi:hypothetical protein BDQ17DRAFT_1264675, partial [Cyathus striatus]